MLPLIPRPGPGYGRGEGRGHQRRRKSVTTDTTSPRRTLIPVREHRRHASGLQVRKRKVEREVGTNNPASYEPPVLEKWIDRDET
jgi:hypothetical protein